jgi:DNA-binding GntR family transcriptional regulator
MSLEASSAKLLESLGARIISGEMPPGMKLTEASLAKQLGVSRAPLREALLKLEERQLIERVPFSGMRVAVLSPNTIFELFEIREVLEGLACRKAAGVITDAEVGALRAMLRDRAAEVARLGGQDTRKLSAIGGFHSEIARIAGNAELYRMLRREVWQFLRVNYQIWSRTSARLDEAMSEHERIVDALEARDGALAELLMCRHIAKARSGLMAGYDQHTGKS